MADEPKKKLTGLAKGFRARTLVTAKLATKFGISAAKAQLGIGAGDSDASMARKAHELVAEMGALKGFVMKVGQMASYLPGALPPEAQRVMTSLQAQSVALEWSAIEKAVLDELGDSPDSLFQDFAREPLAAASIGQVHRARFEGREVAVKVQYPGIDALLGKDLDTVKMMSRVAFLGTHLDGVNLVEELRARMLEECDYLNEAKNQHFYRRLVANDPSCHVPMPIDARTSRRVLTTELVHAKSFYDFAGAASQATKNAAALTIFRKSFGNIFQHCFYNADPHPGNYLFDDDGRVTFLDFGCLRYFDVAFIDAWKAFARSYFANDKKGFREGLIELGLVGDVRRFDFDAHWAVTTYLYRPFIEPKFRFTQDYVRESYDILLFKNPNRGSANLSPEWLFLNRLQWGLNSVLALLDAEGPFRDLWHAFVNGPTEPLRP